MISQQFDVAEKIGLPEHVLNRAKQKVQTDKLKLNSMLSTLHKQKHQLEKELNDLKLKQEQAEAEGGKYSQLTTKLEEKLVRDQQKREELKKLAELGRKMQTLTTDWEKIKDKKEIIKKFVGMMTAEKKKKEAENTPEKISKRRKALIEKLKAEIAIGSRVRMLKGKQVGIVEVIKKNIITVNFGTMMATVGIENLELAEE